MRNGCRYLYPKNQVCVYLGFVVSKQQHQSQTSKADVTREEGGLNRKLPHCAAILLLSSIILILCIIITQISSNLYKRNFSPRNLVFIYNSSDDGARDYNCFFLSFPLLLIPFLQLFVIVAAISPSFSNFPHFSNVGPKQNR